MPDISSSLSKREVNARQNTYTKSEIDLKDGAIQAIAEAAQTTADAAEKKNQEQDQLIAELQKSSHSHSNRDVLDKIEQPYTTAERDKLAGLENYTHPTYTAHAKGFYKFASDGEGHVTDAEEVTASDLYNAGGVIQSALNLYDYIGYIPLSFMTLYYGGGLKNIAEITFLGRDSNKKREIRLRLGGRDDMSTGCLNLVDYNGCQYVLRPNPDSPGTQYYGFYFPKQGGTLALTKDIPDISGKQDKSTAVTHSANTAVGSTTKPVYIAANGAATPISHSINADVPANAKFTDTTYSDATQSTHGLMTAADKKKLDGIAAGATKVAVDSALSATSTNPVQNKIVQAALNGKAASGHTHAMIANSALWVSGANNTAKWVKLGTLVSSGNFSNAMIRVWSGDGANGRANQNSSFEVQIKDGWQSTESATKACGVTVYRVDCSSVKVKVIPTAHDTYTVWAYLPWGYWNGNYAVYGKYKSWTSQQLIQSEEPEGTGANTAYYDQAFLTSTVANATTWNGLINDVDTYNSSDTGILVKKDNRIQHRYAGELDVNSAKTLVDSGWKKPTFASGVKSSSIRYRKQGKIVSVTGYVQFSAEQTTITVFTLPTGYRPPAKIQQFNAVDSSAQASFLTKIDTDGKVGFFGKTRGFFTTATEYYMHCTFFVD